MDNKTKEAFKQLQQEMRAMQSAIDQIRPASPAGHEADEQEVDHKGRGLTGKIDFKSLTELLEPVEEEHPAKSDAAVGYALVRRPAESSTVQRSSPTALSYRQLLAISDERVAAIANAVSAPPKVAILRTLFALPEGRETAAHLGEKTNLSSGSLYYHLRDLSYVGLIEQTVRGSYTITEKGVSALLLISALAVEA